MKHRITRVTTRAGDTGQTSLADGTRTRKTDPHIDAIGAVDELNSFVGVLIAELPAGSAFVGLCQQVQQELFDLGANLATRGRTPPPAMDAVEREIERQNATLPPLTEFVLPGGTRAAAAAHVCRAVCRRAERAVWVLAEPGPGDETGAGESAVPCAQYLNRLSDLFFVLARCCNAGHEEAQWRGTSPEPPP